MQSSSSSQHLADLPESLRKQLAAFKRQLWSIKITEAVLAGLLGLLISYGLVFLLDRFWELSPWLRLTILLSGMSIAAVFAPIWINRWVFKHRRENQIARLITKKFPLLGDRLLGVVELQHQDDMQKAISPELRRAAMQTVAKETQKRELGAALPNHWLHSLGTTTAIIAIAATTAYIRYPEAGKNALQRWFLPLSDTPRYTFTKIDTSKIPEPLYVPYDEPFSVSLPLATDTKQRPKAADARYGAEQWQRYALNQHAYLLRFPGKRDKSSIELKIGDYRKKLPVVPVQRPKLLSSSAIVHFPDYLMRGNEEIDFNTGVIDALVGSEVSIRATFNSPLSHAITSPVTVDYINAQPSSEQQEIDAETINIERPSTLDIKHVISGSDVVIDPIQINRAEYTLPLSWRDKFDIAARKPTSLTIRSIVDKIPSTYLHTDQKNFYLLHDEILTLEIHAKDDFGIKNCGIAWQTRSNAPSQQKTNAKTYFSGDPYKTFLAEKCSIDFIALDIPAQTIALTSWVEDYNASNGRIHSPPVYIHLLNKVEHAKRQRHLLESSLQELDEAMRQERQLTDTNELLKETLKNPNTSAQEKAESKKTLSQQKMKEAENKDSIEKIAKKLEDIFKESAKNDSINKKTLKDISDAAEAMQQMSQLDMPEIEMMLGQALNKKNSDEATNKKLKQAVEKQKELLKKMAKTMKKFERAKEKLEAGSFANRLKQAARDERSIGNVIIDKNQLAGGLHYAQLDPAVRRATRQIYTKQKQITSDISWIIEDLNYFHLRTQQEEYKKIHDSMVKSGITDSLAELEKLIEHANGYRVLNNSRKWAKVLSEWAKQLENTSTRSGGGSGGGQVSEDQDFEFMLRVMRMIQKQQKIRARTRALEQLRRGISPQPRQIQPAPPQQ